MVSRNNAKSRQAHRLGLKVSRVSLGYATSVTSLSAELEDRLSSLLPFLYLARSVDDDRSRAQRLRFPISRAPHERSYLQRRKKGLCLPPQVRDPSFTRLPRPPHALLVLDGLLADGRRGRHADGDLLAVCVTRRPVFMHDGSAALGRQTSRRLLLLP